MTNKNAISAEWDDVILNSPAGQAELESARAELEWEARKLVNAEDVDAGQSG